MCVQKVCVILMLITTPLQLRSGNSSAYQLYALLHNPNSAGTFLNHHEIPMTHAQKAALRSLLGTAHRTNHQQYREYKNIIALRQQYNQRELQKKQSVVWYDALKKRSLCVTDAVASVLCAGISLGLAAVTACAIQCNQSGMCNEEMPTAVYVTAAGAIGWGALSLHLAYNSACNALDWARGDFNENIKQARIIEGMFREIEEAGDHRS